MACLKVPLAAGNYGVDGYGYDSRSDQKIIAPGAVLLVSITIQKNWPLESNMISPSRYCKSPMHLTERSLLATNKTVPANA